MQITQQVPHRDIQVPGVLGHAIPQRLVHVPAAVVDFDKSHAVLHQTSRQQAALAERVIAVSFTDLFRFFFDVEHLQ